MRALKGPWHWLISALSFVAIFFLALPFPLIILVAAIIGLLRPGTSYAQPYTTNPVVLQHPGKTLGTIAIWLSVWFFPLMTIALIYGKNHLFTQLGWFFSKLAVVTFGGAYAVLAYMAQDVVVIHGWLSAEQMMDGLGLAETTPGPTILVTEFVGFVSAWQQLTETGLAAGLLGAFIAIWATFAPCFLWIFTGAPYVEWITAQPKLRGALLAITAAVVGVILNLILWFALHVFFGEVRPVEAGIFKFWVPTVESLDWRVLLPALASGITLLYLRRGIFTTLGIASAIALVIKFGGF